MGPVYLLATQIPVIQCQVPLTRSSVCWQGYSTDKYLHPCDCERKSRGKRSRENRPHGWHEFLESHFEPLSVRPAWEVIDSGTVEAFFFPCETSRFANGWLHKSAWLCSCFPSRMPPLPNFNFHSSLLFN